MSEHGYLLVAVPTAAVLGALSLFGWWLRRKKR